MVTRVFTYLPFMSLLAVTSTCRRWRAVAIAVPELWSNLDIRLRELSLPDDEYIEGRESKAVGDNDALKLLKLFLKRSKQQPFTLRCIATDDEDHLLISKQLLDSLVPHWHRIRALAIPLGNLQHAVLKRAAPALEELIVGKRKGSYNDQPSRCLPEDLLSGIPGRLRRLVLIDVDVPSSTLSALSSVNSFYGANLNSDSTARTLAQCQALERATILRFEYHSYQQLITGTKLKTLRLDFRRTDVAALLHSRIQFASLRELNLGRISTNQLVAVGIVFGHLAPLTSLRLTQAAGDVTAALSAVDVRGASFFVRIDDHSAWSSSLEAVSSREQLMVSVLSQCDMNQMGTLHVSDVFAGIFLIDAVRCAPIHTLIVGLRRVTPFKPVLSLAPPTGVLVPLLRTVVFDYSNISGDDGHDEDACVAALNSAVTVEQAQLDLILVRPPSSDAEITSSSWSQWDDSLFPEPPHREHRTEDQTESVFVRSSLRPLNKLAKEVLFEIPVLVL